MWPYYSDKNPKELTEYILEQMRVEKKKFMMTTATDTTLNNQYKEQERYILYMDALQKPRKQMYDVADLLRAAVFSDGIVS
jgi:hypothetical protein